MTFLLDTHAFLWFVLDNPRLSPHALSLISDPSSSLYFSAASYWEIAIKVRLGKFQLAESFEVFMTDQIQRNVFVILPITLKHAAVVSTLPFHHRDPFDRMLVSQALVEQVPLLSSDSAFDLYPVSRVW